MPIVDPMDGFRSFQQAYSEGLISLQQCQFEPELFAYQDKPEGELRLTFTKIEKGKPVGFVQIVVDEPNEGVRCFGIGYAVDPAHRGRGVATDMVQKAISEFSQAMKRQGLKSFYFEAVIGRENVASLKVAKKILALEGEETTDMLSGEPAYQFMKHVQT